MDTTTTAIAKLIDEARELAPLRGQILASCSSYIAVLADTLEAVTKERDALLEQIDSLFAAIKHGDEPHRAWLKAKIHDHFALASRATK